ncbi:hypothetical protein C8J56DRAFT_1039194 [Mycena floridula]|nr:hypothetical protein C8J56DRAFT_1039194 [Mycena floridula]
MADIEMPEIHNSPSDSTKKFRFCTPATEPLKAQDSIPQFNMRAPASAMLKHIHSDDVNSSCSQDTDATMNIHEDHEVTKEYLPPAQDYRVNRLASINTKQLRLKAADMQALNEGRLHMEADLIRQAQELENAKQKQKTEIPSATSETKDAFETTARPRRERVPVNYKVKNFWHMSWSSGCGMYNDVDRLAKLRQLGLKLPQCSPETEDIVIDSLEPQLLAEHLFPPEQSNSSPHNPAHDEPGPFRLRHDETQAQDPLLTKRMDEYERAGRASGDVPPQRCSNRPKSSKTSQESGNRGSPHPAVVNSFNTAIRVYINNLLRFEGLHDHQFPTCLVANLWNQQLADMFVEDWKASDDGRKYEIDDDDLRKKFKQRIKTLCSTFSSSLVLARDAMDRHHGATKVHWQMLFYMVQKLGAEGMSSDDSEGEVGSRRFMVWVREWRSQPLLALLHHIDQNQPWYSKYSNAPAGNAPHTQLRSQFAGVSQHGAMRQLPANWYRMSYLNSLSAAELKDLGMLPDMELLGIELLDEIRQISF